MLETRRPCAHLHSSRGHPQSLLYGSRGQVRIFWSSGRHLVGLHLALLRLRAHVARSAKVVMGMSRLAAAAIHRTRPTQLARAKVEAIMGPQEVVVVAIGVVVARLWGPCHCVGGVSDDDDDDDGDYDYDASESANGKRIVCGVCDAFCVSCVFCASYAYHVSRR